MFAKVFLYGFIALGLIGVAVFSYQNPGPVSVKFLQFQMVVPLWWITVKTYLVGLLSTYFYFRLSAKQQISQARVTEWQGQDAKLQAEIAKDETKLLEAKVATLEAAIEKALKRKS